MVVQHNISAMTANRYYTNNNSALGKSMEKLSSGLAINRAGDNAAGLAVSEKMRAQIAGLSQASKNAQDGISMVQTFEGALQETDSILQRMRTLAVQSANGSYANEVDRDAIQLEFDQLNDELNQIADTDYNGVVVLNGGTMADGVKADANGKIDYSAAQKAAAENEAAKKAAKDFSGDADSPTASAAGNIVDSVSYTKTQADGIWKALGVQAESTDSDAPDELSITFTYDGEDWKATGVNQTVYEKDENGAYVTNDDGSYKTSQKALDVTQEQLDKIVAKKLPDPATAADGEDFNGGFKVFYTDENGVEQDSNINLVFDTTSVGKYDTATVKATNVASEQKIFDNYGFDESGVTLSDAAKAIGYKEGSTPTVTMDAAKWGTDADMDGVKNAILTALNDMTFKATYTDQKTNELSAIETTTATSSDAVQVGDFDYKITTGAAGTGKIEIFEHGNTTAMGQVDWAIDSSSKDTINLTYKTVGSSPTAAFTGTTLAGATTTNAETFGSIKVAELAAKASGTSSTATFGLNFDSFAFTKAEGITAKSAVTPDSEKAINKATSDDADAVAKSNALNNGQRNLTYAQSMSLQTGARSKDLVEFTFKYNTDAMGDLTANMNCSAREGGLGTEKLSLKTQEGANAAIDKIDNAINKVSMVRATFGAIQNRLEHKISNLDTNAENITAAESRIRDTQMDQEMMKFTSAQILSQASQSMLAQANSLPQGVLQLLG